MALSFKNYLDFVAKLSKQTKLSYRPHLADGMKPFFKGYVLQQELDSRCPDCLLPSLAENDARALPNDADDIPVWKPPQSLEFNGNEEMLRRCRIMPLIRRFAVPPGKYDSVK